MSISIIELAKSVREQNLDKDKLEQYYAELTSLFTEMSLETATLEKQEAIFLNECGEKTRTGAERQWYAKEQGQRQIELKHTIRAVEKLISSIKHRIYNTYG